MGSKEWIEVTYGDMIIKIEGKSQIFGGLDLQVNAIKALISMMDMKFAEEKDEYARDKVYLQILDAVGSHIRLDSIFPAKETEKNVHVTKKYLDWIIESEIDEVPQIKMLLDAADED